MDESLEEEGRDKQVGIEGVGVELSGEGSPGRRMKLERTGQGWDWAILSVHPKSKGGST